MAKRRADTDLNHDNWDREESPEPEHGSGDGFKRAPEDVLAKRKIKVARRRGPADSVTTGGSEGPSVFKNFTGFGSIGSSNTASSKLTFDFTGAKSPAQTENKKTFEASSFKLSGGSSSPATKGGQSPASNLTTFSFGSVNNFEKEFPIVKSKTPNGVGDASSNMSVSGSAANAEGNNTAYLAKLKVLNEGVLQWIQKHLAENININLNPVFEDYRRHFDELQETYKPKFTKNEKSSASKSQTDSSVTVKNGNASPDKQSSLGTGGASPNMDKMPSFSFHSTSKDSKQSPLDSSKNKEASTFPFSSSSSMFSKETSKSSSQSSDSKAPSIPAFPFGSSVSNESKPKDSTPSSFGSSDFKSKPFSLSTGSSSTSGGVSNVSSSATSSTFSFGGSSEAAKNAPGTFSFGGSTGPLTFGAKGGSPAAPGSGFSFGGATPDFSFGSGNSAAAPPANSEDQEDETPPKPEVVEVKEEDAFYEKKCKLFYKKDGVFTDKGVGTLFLKTAGDTNKTQLIVRAATNLGNVLLNIVLNKSLPTQRMGKNNVLIVCVPNPPLDPTAKETSPTPVTMLIRVKTAEDADDLLAKIDEQKAK